MTALFSISMRIYALTMVFAALIALAHLFWQAHEQTFDTSWLNQPIHITADIRQARQNSHYQRLQLQHITRDDGQTLNGDILVYSWSSKGKTQTWIAGQHIALQLILHKPHQRQNPGGFDYLELLRQQHIVLTGSVRGEITLLSSHLPWLADVRQRIRQALPDASNARGILSALLLAERDKIPIAVVDAFAATGTAHILAISGMHLGMVAAWAIALCWWLLTRRAAWIVHLPIRHLSLLVGVAFALVYASIAAWPLPSQRAAMLLCATALSWWLRQRYNPLRTLLLALFIILLWQPSAITSLSLWLSFVAAAGLLFFAQNTPSNESLSTARRIWKSMKNILWVSIIATLVTLPIIADVFGRIPLWSLPANLLVVVIYAFWVLPLALLGEIMVILYLPDAAQWLMQLAAYGINLSTFSLLHITQWPGGKLWVPDIPLWLSLLYAVGLLSAAYFWQQNQQHKANIILFTTLLLFLFIAIPEKPPHHMKFIAWDVGQGAASTLIQVNGHVTIIDIPGKAGSRFNGGTIIADGLRNQGLTHANIVILSHAQSDHAGGILRLLDSLNHVDELWLADVPANHQYPILQQAISRIIKHGGHIRWLKQGRQYLAGKATIDVLWPPTDFTPRNNNNTSLVISLHLPDGTRLLAPGDAEKEVETALLKGTQLFPHQILLMPHHGSRTSSSLAWIHTIDPKIVIAQTGFHNHFGFPKPDIVQRYLNLPSPPIIMNTANGAIIATWRGGEIAWQQFNSHQQDKWQGFLRSTHQARR